jgi:hypothetical protein
MSLIIIAQLLNIQFILKKYNSSCIDPKLVYIRFFQMGL